MSQQEEQITTLNEQVNDQSSEQVVAEQNDQSSDENNVVEQEEQDEIYSNEEEEEEEEKEEEIKTLDDELLDACIKKDFPRLKLALEKGASASYNKYIEGVWGAYEEYGPIHKVLLEWKDDLHIERNQAIELLLSKGANVNAKYGSSNWKGSGSSGTAFEIVLQMNDIELINLFLKYGANPNTCQERQAHTMRYDGSSSYPFLYQSVKYGNLDLFKCLLQNNVNTNLFAFNRGSSEYGPIDDLKEIPLHLACRLFKPINNNLNNNLNNNNLNEDEYDEYDEYDENIDENDKLNKKLNNYKKYKEMILLLIKYNSDINIYGKNVYQIPNEEFPKNIDQNSEEYYEITNPRGDKFIPSTLNIRIQYTPLHLAIKNQNEELFNILLFNGANSNINYLKNNNEIITTLNLLKEFNLNWNLYFEWNVKYHQYLPLNLKNNIKQLHYISYYLNWPLNLDTLSIIYTFICLDYFYENDLKFIENRKEENNKLQNRYWY